MCLTACTSKLISPSSTDLKQMQTKVPEMTIETATKGRRLYVQYCGSCHHLYEPSKFTDKEWSVILIKMIPKAKLADLTDQQLIKDYLTALSK
jgi:hypothetical protein